MATPSKNPQKSPPESPIQRYYRTDAARYMGLTLSSIKRLEKEGILTPNKDDKGQHWFELSDLEAYRAERAGMPSPEVEKIVATIDSAASQADKSARHVERTLNIVLDPSESLLAMYQAECAALRGRCNELQGEVLVMLTQLREILKDQRQEDMQERDLERGARRKDMALAMVKDALPLIVSQIGGKETGKLLSLVRSFTPQQLSILSASGLLTSEQVAALSTLLTTEQRSALSVQPDTSEEETRQGANGNAPDGESA